MCPFANLSFMTCFGACLLLLRDATAAWCRHWKQLTCVCVDCCLMQGGHGVRSIHCGCSTIWGYVCVCMSHSQHHTPKSSCPPDLTTVAMQAPLPWLVTPTRSFEFVATGDLPRQQLQQARHAAWTTLLYSAPLANWYVPRAKQKSQKIALTLYIC